MNRVEFEERHQEMDLERKGNGEYFYSVTRAAYAGWCAGLECVSENRKWRTRSWAELAKAALMAALMAGVGLEFYVLAHFALKFW
jgi:hypothetical protein